VARRPSWAAAPLGPMFALWTAAGAAIFHKGLDLLDLLGREHTSRGKHCLHALLFHLPSQRVHLIKFLHDRVLIRIIRPQELTKFNVAQFHIGASLYGSLLGVHTDRVQASHLLVRETEILAHAGIFRHAHKTPAATKSAVAAALPPPPAPSGPALPPLSSELALAASRKAMLAVAPLMLSAAAHLMLALPRAGPLRSVFLSPTDNRRRQQYHKT
jgi:hypothetical protein